MVKHRNKLFKFLAKNKFASCLNVLSKTILYPLFMKMVVIVAHKHGIAQGDKAQLQIGKKHLQPIKICKLNSSKCTHNA